MLALLDSDRIRYYQRCADLSLAGDDYKVNEIICFAKDECGSIDDFAQIKKYDDEFMLIVIYTEDENLISECMDCVSQLKDDFSEIEIRTPYASVLEMNIIRDNYILGIPKYKVSPVYYMYSQNQLPHLPEIESLSISLFKETDKAEIAKAEKEGKLDSENMNADMFVPYANFKDVKWYILRCNGEIAGYLRAECGYANIYDIGWLYVEPRFRGQGFAPALVVHFSKDMFVNGKIPHYGYAISEESARVAEKCGYICDKTNLYCRTLKPL